MTIVVWRSGVLAADTLAMNGLKLKQSKLRRLYGGRIMGFSGTLVDCIEYVKFLNGQRDDLPEWDNGEGCKALVINADLSAHVYEDGKGPMVMTEEYVAIGSGSHIAYGAMHMGATAVQAVEAAIRWDGNCGGDVETMKLEAA